MTGRIPKVVVIGPTYVELAVRCGHLPLQGEFIEGSEFSSKTGGAGPNRAIESSLCGCQVHLISKIGDDIFGQQALEMLKKQDVNTDFIYTAPAMSTGILMTFVDSMGENSGCVCKGANKALNSDEIAYASAEQIISDADACLICSDLPDAVVRTAINTAKLYNTKVILEREIDFEDPSDITHADFPKEYYLADILVPIFKKALLLIEQQAGFIHKLKMVGSDLVANGFSNVVIHMGSRGNFVANHNEMTLLPGFDIDCVDRTYCCDVFLGAFAASVSVGDSLRQAAKFASAAAAIVSSRFGTIDSLPTKEEILELLLKQSD